MARKVKIVARWDGHALIPAAMVDREALAAAEIGALFALSKYRPRSDAQSRLLHAMIHRASDNSIDGYTEEFIKGQVKLRNGWFEGARVEVDGSVYTDLRSTADFTLDEMKLFIEQTIDFIAIEMGMDVEALRREAEVDTQPSKAVRS